MKRSHQHQQEKLTASTASVPNRRRLRPNTHPLLRLQHSRGNFATQRFLQAKLKVNTPGDKYEQEADRVADMVVERISSPVQDEFRKNTTIASSLLQMNPNGLRSDTMITPPALESAIKQQRGLGHPLANNVRNHMERAFGVDFGDVHIHDDSISDDLNHILNARAFTTKKDIFFRKGEYNPNQESGLHLIAHELTHVLQQKQSSPIQRSSDPVVIQRIVYHDMQYERQFRMRRTLTYWGSDPINDESYVEILGENFEPPIRERGLYKLQGEIFLKDYRNNWLDDDTYTPSCAFEISWNQTETHEELRDRHVNVDVIPNGGGTLLLDDVNYRRILVQEDSWTIPYHYFDLQFSYSSNSTDARTYGFSVGAQAGSNNNRGTGGISLGRNTATVHANFQFSYRISFRTDGYFLFRV